MGIYKGIGNTTTNNIRLDQLLSDEAFDFVSKYENHGEISEEDFDSPFEQLQLNCTYHEPD